MNYLSSYLLISALLLTSCSGLRLDETAEMDMPQDEHIEMKLRDGWTSLDIRTAASHDYIDAVRDKLTLITPYVDFEHYQYGREREKQIEQELHEQMTQFLLEKMELDTLAGIEALRPGNSEGDRIMEPLMYWYIGIKMKRDVRNQDINPALHLDPDIHSDYSLAVNMSSRTYNYLKEGESTNTRITLFVIDNHYHEIVYMHDINFGHLATKLNKLKLALDFMLGRIRQ